MITTNKNKPPTIAIGKRAKKTSMVKISYAFMTKEMERESSGSVISAANRLIITVKTSLFPFAHSSASPNSKISFKAKIIMTTSISWVGL